MSNRPKFLMYRGKPLVRFENIIFYGSLADKYIIMMQVLDSEPYAGQDITKATKVAIQLQLNGDDVKDRIVKETVKPGMAPAMEIATVWLERALKEA